MAGGESDVMIKWIGAVFIVCGCGMVGFSMAAAHRREENLLRQLIGALDYIQCELQYHLTPLPELCRQAGMQRKSVTGQVLLMLARELDCQTSPDVECCMNEALCEVEDIPERTKHAFEILGASLGRFDLEGQVRGLEAVRCFCRKELEELSVNREVRLRSYQTLGLCAGAAVAILFV